MKTKQAGVERYRPVFTQIGYIVALGITLMAFEWKTYEKAVSISLGPSRTIEIEELAPVTMQPKLPPPPVAIAQFTLNNDPEIDIPDLFIDAGIDDNIPVEPWIPPALTEDLPVIDDTPRVFVEIMPTFPGGESAMRKFLGDRLRYPEQAKAAGISGTVYLSFVVERNGNISHVEILRGVEVSLNEEAIRVIKSMPAWSPGIQAGRPVRVKFNTGIKFVLE
ncbi:MAG: energy transducer TonB [Bacteroidales bacterium]|nr:energy transducer TonB [Bacteroidales bacterium]